MTTLFIMKSGVTVRVTPAYTEGFEKEYHRDIQHTITAWSGMDNPKVDIDGNPPDININCKSSLSDAFHLMARARLGLPLDTINLEEDDDG